MQNFVHAPPDLSPNGFQPVEDLIVQVASKVGGPDDPETRSLAIRCLDRAADRMNMAGIFMFRRKDATYSSLTLGQSTLTLPDDWGWPEGFGAAYLSDELVGRIDWVAWDIFLDKQKSLDTTSSSNYGSPQYLSLRSELEEVAFVFPYIDTSEVDRLVLPYYSRVQRISEETDTSLLMTPEVRETLLTGGEAFILRYEFPENPQVWLSVWNDFQQTVQGSIGVTARRQKAQNRQGWMRPG